MTKTLLSTVRSANEFASDYPVSFAILLTDAMKARIKELAAQVKSLGVLRIEEFNYNGIWSVTDFDELNELLEEGSSKDIFETINESKRAVEIPILAVYENRFHFTAIPKHCGDCDLLVTETFNISDLENSSHLIKA
tara:strand:- start:490 stop:900 length:411 start_codon:yes stop_codon:yes gene_type:complete